MKSNTIILFCLLLFVAAGCYKDKGSYDYHDVNDLTVNLLPESNGALGAYIVKQPAVDTLFFTLKPVVAQSLGLDEKNLVYRWCNLGAKVADTVFTKEFIFKFPPKVVTSYHYLFSVKDVTTDIEYFRDVALRTMVPYRNSWLVLHGDAGDRKIGAVERESDGGITFTEDVYKALRGGCRFQNATSLMYSAVGANAVARVPERLMVLEPDSCFYLYPFNCDLKAKYDGMMPPKMLERPRLNYGVVADAGNVMGLVDEQGKYYHGGAYGFFYNTKVGENLENYHVDKVFISSVDEQCVTIWDAVHRKLIYYSGNWYKQYEEKRQDPSEFNSVLTVFPEDVIGAGELTDTEVLWIGRGMKPMANSGASVVLKDTKKGIYSIYHVGYGEKGGDEKGGGEEGSYVKIVKDTLNEVNFNENSLFAVSEAFNDQLFYTLGNNIYLYNTVSGEDIFLYSAGQNRQITKLAFKMANIIPDFGGGELVLGVAVKTADGKGELHEILLTIGGDVNRTEVYNGFGEIQDFCFTTITQNW